MYDTIIIGSGPAGMTAGIYAARREMKALIIGKELGGQVSMASEIENWPGYKTIQSFELIKNMQEQVKYQGVEIVSNEVMKINKNEDDTFSIFTGGEEYQTRTIIVAIGLSPRRLAIKGEIELTGKGVSYCATCDSPFFREKTVAVVGGGNAALDAAEVLSKIAKKVYLIHRSQDFKAFETLVDEVKAKENVEFILDSAVEEISGENKVEKIKIKNVKSNENSELSLDGIFIEIGRIASTDLIANFADRDERNQILVDEKCRTKTPGIFAAGDVTQVPFKQITIACGQATIAALSAYQYLQVKQGGKEGVVLDRSKHK